MVSSLHCIIFGIRVIFVIHVQFTACKIFNTRYCSFLAGLKHTLQIGPCKVGDTAGALPPALYSSFTSPLFQFYFLLPITSSLLSQFSVIFFFVLTVSFSFTLFTLYISVWHILCIAFPLTLASSLCPLTTHTTTACSLSCLHFKLGSIHRCTHSLFFFPLSAGRLRDKWGLVSACSSSPYPTHVAHSETGQACSMCSCLRSYQALQSPDLQQQQRWDDLAHIPCLCLFFTFSAAANEDLQKNSSRRADNWPYHRHTQLCSTSFPPEQ